MCGACMVRKQAGSAASRAGWGVQSEPQVALDAAILAALPVHAGWEVAL